MVTEAVDAGDVFPNIGGGEPVRENKMTIGEQEFIYKWS